MFSVCLSKDSLFFNLFESKPEYFNRNIINKAIFAIVHQTADSLVMNEALQYINIKLIIS